MKAILLNRTGAREIELPSPEAPERLSAMQEAIGCRCLAGAGFPDDDHAAYIDDEGLLTLEIGESLLEVTFYPDTWLAGNILITGFDVETGEDAECTLTPEAVEKMVIRSGRWMPRTA